MAYELIRRSSTTHPVSRDSSLWNDSNSWYTKSFAYGNHTTPSVNDLVSGTSLSKDEELAKMNPQPQRTLEEKIVDEKAPIGTSPPLTYVTSNYQPIADKTTASPYV